MQTESISFTGKTEAELKAIPLKIPIEWKELAPFIENAVKLRSDESLEGIILQNNGVIHACISRKRGRKERETDEIELFKQPT